MPQPIVINDFKKGVAQNPYEGFADMRNVILDGASGGIEIGWQAVRVASTAISDQIMAFTKGNNLTVGATGTAAGFFAISRDGEVLYSAAGDSPAASWEKIFNLSGNVDAEDIKYWQNFLLLTNNTNLFSFGPLHLGSAVLTQLGNFNSSDSQTLDRFHPILIGQDNVVYVGDERYLASLTETSGSTFFGGTASTYSFNNNALDLPAGYRIKTLAELGQNLQIGTWQGRNSDEVKVADIFPWDRVSDSFGLPLKLSKFGIHSMINENNILYFMADVSGELYATNGISVQKVTQIPKHITQIEAGKWIDAYPYNTMAHKSKIYFAGKCSENGVSADLVADGIGVWSYDPQTGALVMENQIDTGRTGALNNNTASELHITALFPVDQNSYLIAFQQETSGQADINGIDLVSNTRRYTNYAARIDSQYFLMGTKMNPRTFSTLEFELGRPLRTDEGIRFFYRTDLDSSFTSIRTFDFATDGAITSGVANFQAETTSGMQIRTEMTTGTNSTTTVELLNIKVQ